MEPATTTLADSLLDDLDGLSDVDDEQKDIEDVPALKPILHLAPLVKKYSDLFIN